ncbi:LFG2 protein, partial [Polypterus senegalus]
MASRTEFGSELPSAPRQKDTGPNCVAMSFPAEPPPNYDEATAGDKQQEYRTPPYTTQPPSSVPVHPSWAYVHPSPSPGYTNQYASEMLSPFSDPSTNGSCDGLSGDSWEDKNIRRMFIRKVDFTSCHGLIFSLAMVLFLTGLVLAFTAPFGYFLAFDVQLLTGNRRYSLSPEEHVFGAMCLYMDIVYIFFFLLQLFGSRE